MCAATQMAVAVHETLSPFMTEMREGLAAVKTEMATMKRNLRVMEGKVNHLSREVTTLRNQSTSGLATIVSVNSSIESVKKNIKAMKTQLNEHKDSVTEELEEIQSSFVLKLDLLDSKQDTLDAKLDTLDAKLDTVDAKQDTVDAKQETLDSKLDTLDVKQDRLAHRVTVVTSTLEARILSNTTRELRRSADNHVTSIASQLTSVNDSIRNKVKEVEKQLKEQKNFVANELEIVVNNQNTIADALRNSTKELERSADNHVTTIASQLTSVNASIRNKLRMMERLIAKNSTTCETTEIDTSSCGEQLETLLNSQAELEQRVLNNITKELERSGESHVTSIESQLTSVDAGIRNELRKIERQITRNSTESERVELEILSHEELLETLAAVNTSISGQVSYIKEDLGHISSSVDRVINGLGECMVTGEQNCSSQPLEECTCDTPVEQNCPEPARPSLDDCQDICELNCTCDSLMENCRMQEVRSDYECGGTGGWRRVVYLNMTDPNTNCPLGWRPTGYSKRTCGRISGGSSSCDSVFFPISGGNYTSVCGSIRAYQYAHTRAFWAYDNRYVTTIDGAYVSGTSLTHGSQRQHIWTFAAGYTEAAGPTDVNVCPCDTSFDIRNPLFMGNDYFCESGVNSGYTRQRLYPDDPLWDGEGCSSSSSCCSFNNPPYFTKQLPSPTSDPIEARLCGAGGNNDEDTPVEFMELYVK